MFSISAMGMLIIFSGNISDIFGNIANTLARLHL